MDLMPVLPIVLVVFVWAVVFVGCFAFFARMLKQPTEAEMEAALEHASAEEVAEAHVH